MGKASARQQMSATSRCLPLTTVYIPNDHSFPALCRGTPALRRASRPIALIDGMRAGLFHIPAGAENRKSPFARGGTGGEAGETTGGPGRRRSRAQRGRPAGTQRQGGRFSVHKTQQWAAFHSPRPASGIPGPNSFPEAWSGHASACAALIFFQLLFNCTTCCTTCTAYTASPIFLRNISPVLCCFSV